MLFMMICRDKPDGLDARMAARPAHLEFLKSFGDRVKLGGAMLDGTGEKPIGSVIVITADSLADAQAIAAQDPYATAGVFESVEIVPFRQAVGVALA